MLANSKFQLILFLSLPLGCQITKAQLMQMQERPPKLEANSLHISLGPGGITYFFLPATVYVEHLFQSSRPKARVIPFADFGGGAAAHWEGASSFIMTKGGALFGKYKRFIEASAGVTYYFMGDYAGDLLPNINLGYRRQSLDRDLIFRVGVGFPEIIYIGWGLSI